MTEHPLRSRDRTSATWVRDRALVEVDGRYVSVGSLHAQAPSAQRDDILRAYVSLVNRARAVPLHDTFAIREADVRVLAAHFGVNAEQILTTLRSLLSEHSADSGQA